MAQYILLLAGGDFKRDTQEEMRAITERYVAWRRKVTDAGRVTSGAPLADDAKVLSGSAAAFRVVDGPFTETKEVIGGYYFFEAPNLEAAVEFARDCPHLDYGGSMELREVIQL